MKQINLNLRWVIAVFALVSCGGDDSAVDKGDGGQTKDDAASPKNNNTPVEFEQTLNVHNQARQVVGITPLTWNSNLATISDDWANACNFEHAQDRNIGGEPFGENLAWGSSGFSAEALTQLWVDERPDFNCNNNSCSGVCGHYTQMIWETTTEIGCGLADCGNNSFLVCRYLPAGNFVGQRPIPVSSCP